MRVVLADQHAAFRAAVQRYVVGRSDIELVAAVDTIDVALQAVAHHMPDVLLIDADLGSSTDNLAARIHTISPMTNVICTGASLQQRDIERALLEAAPNGWGANAPGIGALSAIAGVKRTLSAQSAPRRSRERVAGSDRSNVRPSAGDSDLGRLTAREREVLGFVATGVGKKGIAHQLGLSVHTINRHVTSLMGKLRIHDRVELARFALREGLVAP